MSRKVKIAHGVHMTEAGSAGVWWFPWASTARSAARSRGAGVYTLRHNGVVVQRFEIAMFRKLIPLFPVEVEV